jgi:CheY-like chemotaxis protein
MSISAIRRREGQAPVTDSAASNSSFEVEDVDNTPGWEPDADSDNNNKKKNGNDQSRPRVFILDDDLSIVRYIKALLEDEYDVEGDTNPIDVLYKLRQYQPNLLLLDVMMPNLSGYQLIHLIRMDPELQTLPVILVTARSGFEERQHAMSLGAAELLSKPFEPDQLLSSIDKALCNA